MNSQFGCPSPEERTITGDAVKLMIYFSQQFQHSGVKLTIYFWQQISEEHCASPPRRSSTHSAKSPSLNYLEFMRWAAGKATIELWWPQHVQPVWIHIYFFSRINILPPKEVHESSRRVWYDGFGGRLVTLTRGRSDLWEAMLTSFSSLVCAFCDVYGEVLDLKIFWNFWNRVIRRVHNFIRWILSSSSSVRWQCYCSEL